MLTFKITLTQTRDLAAIPKRELNNIFKAGFEEAGRFWLKEFAPLHFGNSATHRYNYAARSPRTLRIKARAQFVRHWKTRERVPLRRPNGALVWTGDLKDTVLRLASDPSKVKLASSGVGGKEYVRVKIPLPHPMRFTNAEELTRLIPSEIAAMQNVAMNYIHSRLGLQAPRTVTVIAG
jgi:hypothetical protein